MRSFIPCLALLVAFATGTPTPANTPSGWMPPVPKPFRLATRNLPGTEEHFDVDAIHHNVLARNASASYTIVTTDEYEMRSRSRRDVESLLYVADKREWVHLMPYDPAAEALNKRECVSRVIETKVYSKSGKKYWAPWQPISIVMDSRYASQGEISKAFSYSMSISTSIAIGIELPFSAVSGALSASFGVEISESWGTETAYTCVANQGETVQIWAKKYVLFSEMEMTQLRTCGEGRSPKRSLWGVAPCEEPNQTPYLFQCLANDLSDKRFGDWK